MYRYNSNWNEENELRSLLIFKKLQIKGFPRGKQIEYCREMAKIPGIGLSAENISAKVGNYKSVAGVNNKSNASKNTQHIYNKYKDFSIEQLETLIKKHKFLRKKAYLYLWKTNREKATQANCPYLGDIPSKLCFLTELYPFSL